MIRININDDTVPDVDSIKIYLDPEGDSYIETTDGEHFKVVGVEEVTVRKTSDILVLKMGI
jgi:hypothetical protein